MVCYTMYLVFLFWVFASFARGESVYSDEVDIEEIEDEVSYLKKNLHAVTRQLMVQQFYTEERVRSEGHSGIKQIRIHNGGVKNYQSASFVDSSIAAIHNHANNIRTVGMGEFIAVLNGIEFRTRHNDFRLYMPSNTTTEYHATQDITFPDVPDEVLSKSTVKEQIAEMQEWFKAWSEQDATVRNYKQYFKPVLCYLEGAWTIREKKIEESFQSDRHFLDASNWFDLMDKIRFTSYTGSKSRLENLAYLPTKIMSFINDTTPSIVQWNYRILCHPLKNDLKTARLRPVEDLKTRMTKNMNTMKQHEYTRAARFQINPDDSQNWNEGTLDYQYLDELMEEIPGKDNYQGKLFDEGFDSTVLELKSSKKKVVSNYHRWFKVLEKDAMGKNIVRRGFSDDALFAAKTTQDRVAGMTYKRCNKRQECIETEQKWTYAIPLEIIYLTPLYRWNPFNLKYKGDHKSESGLTVTSDKRNGGCKDSKEYDGINSKAFYQTPAEFFGEGELDKDSADTTRGLTCVLDSNGKQRKVRASGTRIFLPKIPGIGELRQRYPIFPVHGEGSAVWKELNALVDVVKNLKALEILRQDPDVTEEDVTLQMSMAKGRNSIAHTHNVTLSAQEVKLIKQSTKSFVNKKTTTANKHQHQLEIRWNRKQYFIYTKCDGSKATCGHPRLLKTVEE